MVPGWLGVVAQPLLLPFSFFFLSSFSFSLLSSLTFFLNFNLDLNFRSGMCLKSDGRGVKELLVVEVERDR